MARFATDPKISTQLGRREAPCLGKCYKAFFFGHYINFIPWHKSHFNVTDVLVLSVTYVFVSYRSRIRVVPWIKSYLINQECATI